jgi:hypothetical protein
VAIRSAVVRPDTIISGVDGQDILMASREAISDAVIRAVDTMILTGGEFTVSSQRVPTGFVHESVCAAAFVTWRNHSAAKPQPEPHAAPVGDEIAQAFAEGDVVDVRVEAGSLAPEPDEDDEADLDEADVEDHVPTAAS